MSLDSTRNPKNAHFHLIYEDDWLAAIHKPAGYHVHPPQDTVHRISKMKNSLALLRDQLGGAYVYPIHRIDAATSGIVLFAKDPETAGLTQKLFQSGQVEKTYFLVSRGWLLQNNASSISFPLRADGEGEYQDANTAFQVIRHLEIPFGVDGIHPTARITLAKAWPITGRMHQIRRHLRHLSHPILGDSMYGDGKWNRFAKQTLGWGGLLLRAQRLLLPHPRFSNKLLTLNARVGDLWTRVFKLFSVRDPNQI